MWGDVEEEGDFRQVISDEESGSRSHRLWSRALSALLLSPAPPRILSKHYASPILSMKRFWTGLVLYPDEMRPDSPWWPDAHIQLPIRYFTLEVNLKPRLFGMITHFMSSCAKCLWSAKWQSNLASAQPITSIIMPFHFIPNNTCPKFN